MSKVLKREDRANQFFELEIKAQNAKPDTLVGHSEASENSVSKEYKASLVLKNL